MSGEHDRAEESEQSPVTVTSNAGVDHELGRKAAGLESLARVFRLLADQVDQMAADLRDCL